MTIKDLKKTIAELPDDMHVVASGSDHSYHPVDAGVVSALHEHTRYYHEDFGEDNTPEADYGKRMKVLVID